MRQPHDKFRVQTLAEGLYRIELDQPPGTPAPFDAPVNVYVIRNDGAVALVNAGHAAMLDTLVEALRSLDIAVTEVDRVVVTALWPDLYGGVAAFPCADAVFLTPPQRIGARLERRVAELRSRFLGAADALRGWRSNVENDPSVGHFVERYLTLIPRNLRVLPVANGHTLNLADRFFRVIQVDGSVPGQMVLHDGDRNLLFSAETTPAEAEAAWVWDARALDDTLRPIFEMDPARVFPNRGLPREGHTALKRATLFLNNFLTNVPFATHGRMNAPELVHRDLGIGDPVDLYFVAMTLGYRALIDTLIAEDLVDGDGRGLLARFGLGETPN